MHHLHRGSLLLSALCAAALFVSCHDAPFEPPPPPPTGMPDWNDPQYDWMGAQRADCRANRGVHGFWLPKFEFRVVDAAPDGRRILLTEADRVVIYDTASRAVLPVFPFSCVVAKWSRSGRYIAGRDGNPGSGRVGIYDAETNRWEYISFPDSVATAQTNCVWLPGDTALAFKNGGRYGNYAVNVAPPFEMHPFVDSTFRTLGLLWENICGLSAYRVDAYEDGALLTVGLFGHAVPPTSYRLDAGIIWRYMNSRVSDDGNWLAFGLMADISATRFATADSTANSMPGLGIIDLRPGSATQYHLYRIYPDYTNTEQDCTSLYGIPGLAWSADGMYVYHEQIRKSDSTTQIVRRNVRTGAVEPVSNFLSRP